MNPGVPRSTGVLPAIRSIFADVLGDDDDPIPVLPAGLPDCVRPVAADAVHRLIDYQGPGYAQLYVARLRRFIGRRNVDDAAFAEITRLMAARMAYDDAIRMAQLKLAEAEAGQGVPPDDVRKLRLDELVSLLPETAADYALWILQYPGWLHLPVTMRFSAAGRLRRRRLRIEASLKRWRLSSFRYARERAWVEHWLHMIDRSLTKQPAAVAAVVATAEMVRGHGDGYARSLKDWNLIVDHLIKPTLDGALSCPDLAGAITEARAAVSSDPRQESLKRVIAGIRERVGAGARASAPVLPNPT
ncbi:MAG: hypothetical protein NTAFB05_22510 [Nitrobacter sp.]|uniref:DUF6537 domain-containing protein n=1 Tax=Nitrobacter sp. TaxID=29420 RepID=UPI00387DE31D